MVPSPWSFLAELIEQPVVSAVFDKGNVRKLTKHPLQHRQDGQNQEGAQETDTDRNQERRGNHIHRATRHAILDSDYYPERDSCTRTCPHYPAPCGRSTQ